LRAAPHGRFAAVLVGRDGRPVAGATVRVEMIAHASEHKDGERTSVSVGFTRIPREVISGSPVEDLFVTTTDASGAFTFRAIGPGSGPKLDVTAADGRALRVQARSGIAGLTRRSLEGRGFVTITPGESTRLVVIPAARVAGRVVTKLPGVRVGGLTASYQESHPPGAYQPSSNFGEQVQTDAEGRFTFD